MGKVKKYRNSLERFLSGEKGQRFFNFAYSIGAAIVIWGALFKILRLPGGDTLLAVGMGTEVLMFILNAFDCQAYYYERDTSAADARREPSAATAGVVTAAPVLSGTADAGRLAEEMERLRSSMQALNQVTGVLLDSYRAITENSDKITRCSSGYVEQMEALNRNVAGLNAIYEIQLKGVGSQLDSIEKVNKGIKDIRDMYEKSASMSGRYYDETEKMTRYMEQLNAVYANMLNAMTVNMTRSNEQ